MGQSVKSTTLQKLHGDEENVITSGRFSYSSLSGENRREGDALTPPTRGRESVTPPRSPTRGKDWVNPSRVPRFKSCVKMKKEEKMRLCQLMLLYVSMFVKTQEI